MKNDKDGIEHDQTMWSNYYFFDIVARKVSREYPFMPQAAIDILSQIALGMDYCMDKVFYTVISNLITSWLVQTQTLSYVMKGMWRWSWLILVWQRQRSIPLHLCCMLRFVKHHNGGH
jgi:hypothetical protein